MTYRKAFRTFLIGAGLVFSTACTSMEGIVSNPDYLSTGAIVEDSSTAYSGQLSCMKWSTPAEKPRIAVGNIRDMTGRFSTFEGAVATQGASLMVMSAVSQAGFPLAERLDTAVAEQELEFANNRLISEAGEPTEDYRKVFTGSIAGSDYILLGGITELNFNVHSDVREARIGPVVGGERHYAMTVALDLRLVNATDLSVVNLVSQRKIIRGREIRAGVFEFIGDTTIDIGMGERAQEPVHTAIRTIIESAVFDLVSGIAGPSAQACSQAEFVMSDVPAFQQTNH